MARRPDLARERLAFAGLDAAEAASKAARLAQLSDMLERQGHARERIRRWFVPGRIEVLGKHTDYAGGRTLTCAAERGFSLAAAPRSDRRVIVTDATRSSTLVSTLDCDAAGGDARWFTYALAVIRRLARNFPDAATGADIALASDLPSASGISSSSALMVALALALVEINALEEDPRWQAAIHDVEDKATYFAAMENGQTFATMTGDSGVGTAGGSEDHTAILCSRAGTLNQFRFCPTRRERQVPLSRDLLFVIGASGVAARKTGEAQAQYNRASRAAMRLLQHWRAATGRSDGSLAAALASASDAVERAHEVAQRAADDEFSAAELVERLEHFIEESERLVPLAADCLLRHDTAGFGAAVDRSQEIAERRLHNQVPETIALARLAREHGALAASAFGAGFGGSVWALVPRDASREFAERWSAAYGRKCSGAAPRATFFATQPGPAAMNLDAG
jgi:galactokinase